LIFILTSSKKELLLHASSVRCLAVALPFGVSTRGRFSAIAKMFRQGTRQELTQNCIILEPRIDSELFLAIFRGNHG
jgi:hypothetical protein